MFFLCKIVALHKKILYIIQAVTKGEENENSYH